MFVFTFASCVIACIHFLGSPAWMYLHRDNPLFSELKSGFAWIDMGRGNLLCVLGSGRYTCGNQRCPLSWIRMNLVHYGICKVCVTHESIGAHVARHEPWCATHTLSLICIPHALEYLCICLACHCALVYCALLADISILSHNIVPCCTFFLVSSLLQYLSNLTRAWPYI